MAKLLVIHAAHIDKPNKISELCVQAYELWLERVRDKPRAAHALARAVSAQPENQRAYDRLLKLYGVLGWPNETADLLTWRLDYLHQRDPAAVPELHLQLAKLYEEQFLATSKAVEHYEQALNLRAELAEASEHLIRLHLQAGAWNRAVDLINAELDRKAQSLTPERTAELHLRLARIQSEQFGDLAGGARHLQAAIKSKPDSLKALRAFGNLYLGSGKATEEGMQKAAGVFLKAAQLATSQGSERAAIKLLRRTLALRPDSRDAFGALSDLLEKKEHWVALDDLFQQRLPHAQADDVVDVYMRRAELLESKLARREDARVCYEEASQYQPADGPAWTALQRIYTDTGDWQALAGLLEYQVEQLADAVPTAALLYAAEVYREKLDNDERAAFFYYAVLEREPFNQAAFEGYKEHWRRKHNWAHLRDLVLYQVDQAAAYEGPHSPLEDPAFAEEFVELADICERRLGDIDGALDAWGRLSAAYPADTRPRDQIARIEKRTRMWDNMVRVQEAELERATDPKKRADVLKRLVQIYRDRQVNPTRAIELYNEILSINPEDIQATRALTALYDRAAEYEHVLTMLRDQYERSRSNTERVSLLRRMAELFHHEVEQPEDAMWACEQILTHAPKDIEAMHRLQLIQQEQEQFDLLLDSLERELKMVAKIEDKTALLRRMARVAERDLDDRERAAEIWQDLLALAPSNLEVVDKMISVYEAAGRYEEMGTLLGKAAASAKTPEVRQLDYLMRLGALAEAALDDPDLARSAYERALRIRPDHRAALESLAQIYREESAWPQLAETLDKLMALADSDDEEYQLGWERAELLAGELDDPTTASQVVGDLLKDVALGNADVNRRLTELLKEAELHRELIGHAELLLLASDSADERRSLFDAIAETWMALEDTQAALAAYTRFIHEFPEDVEGLANLARLQEQVEDYPGAITSLQSRLELIGEVDDRVATLQKMAEIAETGLGDAEQALEYLNEAMRVDVTSVELRELIDDFCARHEKWTELLSLYDERFDVLADMGDPKAQLDTCLDASKVAEKQVSDPSLAFNWVRRGYFLFVMAGLDGTEAQERLEQLAEDHNLWEPLLQVTEQELAMHQQMGTDIEGDFETIERLLRASEIAEHQLRSPERAISYLERAYKLRPDDDELANRLQETAETHKLWEPLITLHEGKLGRAETALGRFDACTAIAKICERQLEQPGKAFEWVRRAWDDLKDEDSSLAEEALELMGEIVERHDLWRQMSEHHGDVARRHLEAGDTLSGVEAIAEAARIVEEKQDDRMGALSILFAGVRFDTETDILVPRLRELAEALDESREAGSPALGALVQLATLERLIELDADKDRRMSLLRERAELREKRMDDPRGAMTEWLRVLNLEPDSGEARQEVERLAESANLWGAYLLLPAWDLQRAGSPSDEAELLVSLADLYEEKLERPEYALRARLESWRRDPSLPESGDLDGEHGKLWELADQVGPYESPALPRDPLLNPAMSLPEDDDARAWADANIDPRTLTPIGQPEMQGGAGVPEGPSTGHTSEISVVQMLDGDFEEIEGSQPADLGDLEADGELDEDDDEAADLDVGEDDDDDDEIEEIDEIEEFEELEDFEEIEEIEDEPVAAGPPAAPPSPPPRRPIPRRASSGLPAIPSLEAAVLPARPRVATAWDELAAAYGDVPAGNKPEKAKIMLAQARLWEEGAEQVERAFAHHEQALLLIPEDPEAIDSLLALSERHAAGVRLLQALETLLAEAALPEHVVAQSMRIARLHEEANTLDKAEERFKGVLAVMPNHVEALDALAIIYQGAERDVDYVDVFGRLLDVQRGDLDDDERIERTLTLAELQEQKLHKAEDALETLYLLLRDFPHERPVHERIIHLLIEQESWPKAIEAMRQASDEVGDSDLTADNFQRIAKIYTDRLRLPDRAIEAWQQYLEVRPDAPEALEGLQTLYLATTRFEQLLPVVDERLQLLDSDDKEGRIALLLVKARALQEGIGDEEGATSVLEELVEEAPDNDDVALGLSRLYRKSGRFEEGVALIKDRITRVTPENHERRIKLASTLARSLYDEANSAEGALKVVQKALKDSPDSQELLELRAEFARILNDLPLVVDSLSALPDLDGLIEAANIARMSLMDGARATRLYARVLAQAKAEPDDTESGGHLVAAIEGLVRVRIDDGDLAGAMEFMDAQLSELEGGTVRAELLTEIGRITYRTTGDVDAARSRFDAALREDPDFSRAKLGLGEVLLAEDRTEEAEKLIEAAVEALGLTRDQKDLVEGLVLLARILETSGRTGEAYRRLSTALRHDPDNLEIRGAIMRNRVTAKRWRDAITSCDQLEQRIAQGELELSGRNARLASDILVYAAQCERELKQAEKVLVRLQRALEIDPENARALGAVVPYFQENGDLAEAAGYASKLAKHTEDAHDRGKQYVEAGMLYHEAAGTLADADDEQAKREEESLRRDAFECVRMGLALVADSEKPILDRNQLEVAFLATAEHNTSIALRCLERLLLRDDVEREHRLEFLLEGSRIGTREDGDLELAERYSRAARELAPHSAGAVIALAAVLELTNRTDELETLVGDYFSRLDSTVTEIEQDRRDKMALLMRLSELQEGRPEKAVESLERATKIDPNGLGPEERKRLSRMYEQTGVTDERAINNHVALLDTDPAFGPSLSALGAHFESEGELDRAYALYRVLNLVDASNETAASFVAGHAEQHDGGGELGIEEVVGELPASAGVPEAMTHLWEGGSSLLSDYLPKVEVDQKSRVSPVADGVLAESWSDVLKRVGQTKVALVDDASADWQGPDEIDDPAGQYFQIRCQQPPVILAGPSARDDADGAELRFALARALFFTRPEAVFAAGLDRPAFASIVSATLQAFHPRHARRKHHQKKGGGDSVSQLSQQLARKLPIRVARKLSNLFKEHESEPFDSRLWRSLVRRRGNRVGLAVSGDLEAALRVVGGNGGVDFGQPLEDPEIRDLVAFAVSDRYTSARRALGMQIQAADSAEE